MNIRETEMIALERKTCGHILCFQTQKSFFFWDLNMIEVTESTELITIIVTRNARLIGGNELICGIWLHKGGVIGSCLANLIL